MPFTDFPSQPEYPRVITLINLIAATHAEADSVISALRLKKIPALLTCYQNKNINLVITGIGKRNTATACGWLAEKNLQAYGEAVEDKSSAWLNFGIAGHHSAELGTLLVAHKVTDFATKKVWYPHRLFQSISSSDLVTVDKPADNYLYDQLHDMEASAFVESARHFSHAELVQSIKVVSDNEEHHHTNLNPKRATQLIAENTEHIVECVENLQALLQSLTPPEDQISTAILENWHFSVSQKVQLKRLVQRYSVTYSPMTSIPTDLQNQKSSKDVLSWLQLTVDSADEYL